MHDFVPEWEHFRPSLVRWAWRGALCALPSFLWALDIAQRPALVWAMVLGVALYVGAFAWVTSLPVFRVGIDPGHFGWALRWASNVRAAIAPLMIIWPDVWLGLISLSSVRWIAVKVGAPEWANGDSFSRIFLTTLVQGALVSATIVLLALVLWPARRAWRRRRVAAT